MKKTLLLCAALAAALASARDTNRYDHVYADANGTVYAQRGGLGTSNYVVVAVSPGDMFRALADGTSPDRDGFGTAVNSVVLVPPQDFRATSLTGQDGFFDNLATNKVPVYTAAFSNAVMRFSPPADFSPDNAELVETIGEVAPPPGDYATVSNKAMTALQSYTETDPTVPGWAKAETKPTYGTNEISGLSAALAGKRGMADRSFVRQPLSWNFRPWQALIPGEYKLEELPSYLAMFYRADSSVEWGDEVGYGLLSEDGESYTPNTMAPDFMALMGVTVTKGVQDELALVSDVAAATNGFVRTSGGRMTGDLVVAATPDMGGGRYVRVDYHGGVDTAAKYAADGVMVNWSAFFPEDEDEYGEGTWYEIRWPYEKTGTVLLDTDDIPWSKVSGRPAIPSYSDVTGIVENATADLASDTLTDTTNWIVRADRTVWSIVNVPVKTNDYFVVDSFESSVASPGTVLARELSYLRESIGDRLDYRYYLPGQPRYCNADTNAYFGGIHYFAAAQPKGWLIMTSSPAWTENPDTSMHAFADGDVFTFTNKSVSAFQSVYGDLYVTLTYHYGVEPARVDTNYVGRLLTDSETGDFAWLAGGTVLETRDGVRVLPSHIGAVSNDSAFAEYVSMSENSVQHDQSYQNVSNRAVNAVQASAAFATATNRAMTAVQPGAAFATATNRAMTAMQPDYEDASGWTLQDLMEWTNYDDKTLYDLLWDNQFVMWDDEPLTYADAEPYFDKASTAVQPKDLRTAKVALANVTNSAGRAVSAGDVGAVSNVIVSVSGKGQPNEVTYRTCFTNDDGGVTALVFEENPTGSNAALYPYSVRLSIDRTGVWQNWRTGDPASPASDLTSGINLGPLYNGFGISAYDPVSGRDCTVMLHPESASGYFMVEDWNSFSRGLSATAAAAETNAACAACVSDALSSMGVALSTNVAETVTNTVRDLSLGGIWDEDLEVWWTPQMKNGSLTYVATTNVNLNAGD